MLPLSPSAAAHRPHNSPSDSTDREMFMSTGTEQYSTLDGTERSHAALGRTQGVRYRPRARRIATSWGPTGRRRGKLAAALMMSLVLLGGSIVGGVMPSAGADDREY